ncbi:PXA domain-domain-containing protein [Leucosporidium creatinivorum]|uniref:PXA domain-domain-containing protein n=1 Tax=Leucosporidium creatinivorum TaxID=106004 RepID=A0A1Y2EYV8_9BASI|nr:PXA domain-domain-containing protein [Leucosporidium creatinivorum]
MSRPVSPASTSFRPRTTARSAGVARPSQPALHQRILYPSPSGPRPPRILHSPAHATLDPLILDLLALICREHILTWYSSISRDPDRAFIQQVTSILIHVIQAVEVRLAHVDLVGLLVLDLPSLLERHFADWDQATEKANTGHAHNFNRDNVFHLLQPHIAVSLSQASPGGSLEPKVDKTYLRALVDNLLRLLLPPEDYRAETERGIVREIIVNTILGSVFTRVAQPWFLHSAIAKILEGRQEGEGLARAAAEAAAQEETNRTGDPKSSTLPPSTVLDRAFAALSSALTLLHAITVSLSALYHTAIASPVPSHYRAHPPLVTPTLSFLVALLPSSPLVTQLVHYLSLPLALMSSFVTSLIFYLVNEKMLNAGLVKTVLEVATRVLFPNGHPAPKEPDPDVDEQKEWKRRCEVAVTKALPDKAATLLLPPHLPDRPLVLARHLLRPLSSHVANVHLFILLIDLIVGKFFPELVVAPEE